jgi:hypothetical protein
MQGPTIARPSVSSFIVVSELARSAQFGERHADQFAGRGYPSRFRSFVMNRFTSRGALCWCPFSSDRKTLCWWPFNSDRAKAGDAAAAPRATMTRSFLSECSITVLLRGERRPLELSGRLASRRCMAFPFPSMIGLTQGCWYGMPFVPTPSIGHGKQRSQAKGHLRRRPSLRANFRVRARCHHAPRTGRTILVFQKQPAWATFDTLPLVSPLPCT